MGITVGIAIRGSGVDVATAAGERVATGVDEALIAALSSSTIGMLPPSLQAVRNPATRRLTRKMTRFIILSLVAQLINYVDLIIHANSISVKSEAHRHGIVKKGTI